MERKEPVDFSSYFYLEASGDSEEADYDDYPHIMAKYACEIAKADTCEDDDYDALSCNGSGACDVAELDEDESCDEQQQQQHHDDDEDKSGVSGMSCCEDGDEIQEEQMKSYVSFDSSQEIVDEMEKNRLFWEACLAS